MSAFTPKADILGDPAKRPLIARSGKARHISLRRNVRLVNFRSMTSYDMRAGIDGGFGNSSVRSQAYRQGAVISRGVIFGWKVRSLILVTNRSIFSSGMKTHGLIGQVFGRHESL